MSGIHWLSLRELSPLATIPEDHLLVVLKSYFDGGNQADSTRYDIVTLAGFSGRKKDWKTFESDWRKVLGKHGADYLHTTDAVGLTGDFSKRKGWCSDSVEEFINSCVSVVEKCATVRIGDQAVKPGVRPVTISLLLKDYKRAILKIPDLGTAEHICATQCVGSDNS